MKNIAIITGASSGIGKQFVLNIPTSLNIEEIWAIAKEDDMLGLQNECTLNIKTFTLDLEKEDSFKKIEDAIKSENPNIKLLVNAAGFGKFEKSTNVSISDSINMIKLNDIALTHLCLMCLKYVKKDANIINISSIASFQPVPYINVYSASKAYVLSFSRALNRELKTDNIHVMAVCPFWTKTNFFKRAVDGNKVVKKYIVMYNAKDVVLKAYKDMFKKKDVSVYGFIANAQKILCKILPHKLVMNIWCKDQKLK